MSTFSKTQKIRDYAMNAGLSAIELIKNPNTDKYFGKDSKGVTYRVSEKITKLTGKESVSWYTPEDGKEPSWMIHPTGESNVVSTLNFGAPVKANKIDDFA